MASIHLTIPDSLAVPHEEFVAMTDFLQKMCNRRAVGHQRYGKINRRQKYMDRLEKELAAYRRKGNMEQLLNVAVYAFLENYAPQNRKWHFDNSVGSVTRTDVTRKKDKD